MRIIFVFLLCSGCAIKSVDEACSEPEQKLIYSSYGECYRDLTEKRSHAFDPGIQWANSLSETPQYTPKKRTDMKCMNDCRALDYSYKYCKSRCEY